MANHTHMFFMDDLKIYAPNKDTLKQTLEVMQNSSQAVGMALRLQKCGVTHMEKGRIQYHIGSRIKGKGVMPEVTDKNMYRYLGVYQVFKANHKVIRAKLIKIDMIWSS